MDERFNQYLGKVQNLEKLNTPGRHFSHITRNILQFVCDVEAEQRQPLYDLLDRYLMQIETNPDFRVGEFGFGGHFPDIPSSGSNCGGPQHYIEESMRRLEFLVE